MTIASALENLNTDIINARTAITTKGGTVTANGGSSQLATDIATIPTGGGSATLITKSITANGTYNASSDNADGYSSVNVNVPTGITPTGTRTITANGTYDVTNYASADVNVSGGASSKYGATVDSFLGDVDANGVLQPVTAQTNLVFTGVEYVPSYALYYRFYKNSGITSVSFPDLTSMNKAYAMGYTFSDCTNITSVDLSSLTRIENGTVLYYTFQNCTNLTSVNLSALTYVGGGSSTMGGAFKNCTSLINLDLSSLTTISGVGSYYSMMGGAFEGCTSLTKVNLPSLKTIGGQQGFYQTFKGCTNITNVDISSLTKISGSSGMGSTFEGLSGITSLLTTISFTSLSVLTGNSALSNCFRYRNGLQSIFFPALTSTSFGSYTNQFNNMLSGVTDCTVHFPSNLQSVIGSWSSVTAGFGGTNTTVLFDLPATT